jgi:pimeloyl-ACP methyl ester carboxylesterase
MPTCSYDDVNLYYEEYGEGFPILLFAPGGMRSALRYWAGSQWNPIEVLAPHFRVIAMDQRNAGKSTAPVMGTDGWHTYTRDHIQLLDHLQIDKCHVMGGCIGGPYCFGMMQEAPDRIASAILQQTIGLDNNRQAFYEMFDSWAEELKESFTGVSDDEWVQFRSNMYDGKFVFNVDQKFVQQCQIPMLVLMGSDLYHPESTSRKIATLAPNVQFLEKWKDPEQDGTVKAVIDFLQECTPV